MGRFPPPGFIEGIQSSFGEFDECLDIKSPVVEEIDRNFNGKYCLLKVKMPFPSIDSYREGEPVGQQFDFKSKLLESYGLTKLSTIRGMIEGLNIANGAIYSLGICIPSVCTADEIEDTINKSWF